MTTEDSRATFDPVDTTFNPSAHSHQRDDVESPSLSSSNALARFEFEPGRSKDGTKVLMVEWEEDDTTRDITHDWEIRWEGKRTTLPARDASTDPNAVNRLYFLLGPGVSIPTTISLKKGDVAWRTNPLPAIFSPELGATARQAGKKGVLHTIWAKKRLQTLQRELDTESQNNAEGVALEMAARELEWIEQNFGVSIRPSSSASANHPSYFGSGGNNLHSPTSPRSPGGSRLMDKLKGLKISTTNNGSNLNSSTDFGNAALDTTPAGNAANPLSPESSDVAFGSFSSFAMLKGEPTAAATSSTAPIEPAPAPRRIAAQLPPDHLRQTFADSSGMGSLNAAFAPAPPSFTSMAPPLTSAQDQDEDDLFALPMSPRSPEMAKSPFSFAASDTSRYAVK